MDFNIPQGSHWIKGNNGSGKTTLFKSLSGMLPYEGNIKFDDGLNLKKHPVKFRHLINYGEADPVYPGFLTGKELVGFVGRIRCSDQEQQNKICNHFETLSFINSTIESYSSGMLKKLSLVLAFLGKPRVIILDEPLITLDENSRLLLFTLINEYATTTKTSFLISSHELLTETDLKIDNTYLIQNKTISLA